MNLRNYGGGYGNQWAPQGPAQWAEPQWGPQGCTNCSTINIMCMCTEVKFYIC